MAGLRRAAFAGAASLAFVAAGAGCGSSSSPAPSDQASPGAASPATVTVDIRNFAFTPTPITVARGTTVIWRNDDASAHTATGDSKTFDTGTVAPGASSTAVVLLNAGTFSYHCAIHQYMTATIVVTS
ncbi:MAG TPA: cupredoxin domain-containing protein [Candidatus Dormibacteraeota bacterium]|nr:cupredoxin domain-containing protein [Candidatus Dormibacteraeota bacterium]